MQHFLILISLLTSIIVYAAEPPAKFYIECSDTYDCKIRLEIHDGWKIYTHDNNNPESLNFILNSHKSENVESIKINWASQKFYSDEVINMKIKYYQPNTDIEFKLNAIKDNYRLVLDINYAACNQYCSTFHDEVVYDGGSIEEIGLAYMLLLALLGGLILNFMPCVLPIVWLKVTYISKKCQKNLKKTRTEISFIILGIIISFLLLAMITISIRNLGHLVGWGMHFQEPLFVGFIATIIAVSSLNMLGLFQIKTPQNLQLILDKTDGKIGDFLHGVFIVLLATPCTAPFLSTAVAYSLTQSSEITLLFYITIGIGLSMPYIALITFSNAIKMLPRPGKWMEKLKLVTAIIFASISLWMFYVLYKQLPDLAIALISIIIILIGTSNIKLSILASLLIILAYSQINPRLVESEEFDIESISSEVELGNTVFVNITSDWCITCKLNEELVLNDKEIQYALKKYKIVMITGDYTSNSKTISNYIRQHKRSGIPLSIVYGPSASDGIILPIIFTKQDVINAINKARRI